MWNEVRFFVRDMIDSAHRHALVQKLARWDDRLLDDIGLPRGQLDTILRREDVTRVRSVVPTVRTSAVRPSLQGCG